LIITKIKALKNYKLLLSVNNTKFIKEVLNTNEVTGNALLVEVDLLKSIDEITFTLNNRYSTVEKCNQENQLFVVTRKNGTVLIKSVTCFVSKR
jgi:hypothetical protein